jgi:hypothetical protein
VQEPYLLEGLQLLYPQVLCLWLGVQELCPLEGAREAYLERQKECLEEHQ